MLELLIILQCVYNRGHRVVELYIRRQFNVFVSLFKMIEMAETEAPLNKMHPSTLLPPTLTYIINTSHDYHLW